MALVQAGVGLNIAVSHLLNQLFVAGGRACGTVSHVGDLVSHAAPSLH